VTALGRPRLHLRETGSTNEVARRLAAAGAPHGTLVTAGLQTAGRGRQGRSWTAPAGRALLCSLVLRELDALLALRGGLAVADVAGPAARVKWPNDVLVDGRKVAGVLAEGRPQEGWAVLGIGINVAVEPADLPEELRERAGTLARAAGDVDVVLEELLAALARRLAEPAATTAAELGRRDALEGAPVAWAGGEGTAVGIDAEGRLRVRRRGGAIEALGSGEVHLLPVRLT
jgi:BirA family biotin operon repressor/biotin-[acetyl-CoA-carboxylase] ligase